MGSRYRLSIIIPVYNAEKHIKECLDSVMDSRSTEYEIILVDDGSADSSPAICDGYAAEHDSITVIHKENGGAASARNAALGIAKGEYITFVDADDRVKPGCVDRLLAALDTGDDIVAFSYTVEYSQNGYSRTPDIPAMSSATAREAVTALDKCGAFNVVWNKVYRRGIITDAPAAVFPEDTEPGEDLIFNCRCFIKAGRVSLVNEACYCWIRRGEDTLANLFRPDLIEKNRLFIGERCRLYRTLGADSSDFDVLSKGNLAYVFSCIPNMYRKGHIFPRRERTAYYKDILGSPDVRSWIDASKDNGALMRQFIRLYKLGSAGIMDAFYSSASWIRRTMDGAWRITRKRMNK